MSGLILTGERTVPGLQRENYWFRRHEAAYAWFLRQIGADGRIVVDAGSAITIDFVDGEGTFHGGAIAPGATMRHVQRTFHIHGTEDELDPLARKLLGTGLDTIKNTFKGK